MGNDTFEDGRNLPIFIHSDIDDMTNLSPNAMRVYMHLARRANKSGQAWPSYQSIGDHCFGCVSDNAVTRRSMARKALDELLKAKLIVKTNRSDDSGNTSNLYTLTNPVPIGTAMPHNTPPVSNRHRGVPIGTKDTPSEDTPIEDTPSSSLPSSLGSKGDGDKAVFTAWAENIPGTMTPILAAKLHDLIDECGVPSVLHGIGASVEGGVRTFNYIAKCARNHAQGKEKSMTKGGGAAPQQRNVNRGRAAATAYMERKGMFHERD